MKNNKYSEEIKKEIKRFSHKRVPSLIISRFFNHVAKTEKLNKEVNIDEHICSFFVPFNRETKSIYLGHHIKADSWIPPGGHVNLGEHPADTVIREFGEELDYTITKDQVETFSLSIKDISKNPRNPCKMHYDFWYLVNVPVVKFNYLKKEFYDAYWHTLDEAIEKINIPMYKEIVRSIKDTL